MTEKKNEIIEKNETVIELDPYTPDYPIQLLGRGLRISKYQAEQALDKVYRAVTKTAPTAAQLKQASEKGFRLVVDAPEKVLDDINKGRIKLSTENSGKMYAQIREANGQYGSKLPIKKQVYAKGVDPIQMANSLQLRSMQEQIEGLEDQLISLNGRVKDVIQGQQNDRIGLYYSGLALYLEAQATTNTDLKRDLLVQSLKALSDATFQLELTMEADIKFLADNSYGKGFKPEMIRERMDNINRAFPVIHQATILRAAIYCNEGELTSMATVLEEYERFIDGPIAKNANLLAQCDERDNGTEKGIWKSRKRMKLDVSDLAKQLKAPQKTIYLDVVEENKNEEK